MARKVHPSLSLYDSGAAGWRAAAAELTGLREGEKETGSLSWEFEESTSFNYLLCDWRNIEMVPIKRNGVLAARPGLDSKGGLHVTRHAHSAPGHDATSCAANLMSAERD